MISIDDPDIHPLVQSAYVEFITSAYVDSYVQECGFALHNICRTFVSYHVINLGIQEIMSESSSDFFTLHYFCSCLLIIAHVVLEKDQSSVIKRNGTCC